MKIREKMAVPFVVLAFVLLCCEQITAAAVGLLLLIIGAAILNFPHRKRRR